MCDFSLEIDGLLTDSASYYMTTNLDTIDVGITE
jgi:hypothetical protein